jgi:hypothetical protein
LYLQDGTIIDNEEYFSTIPAQTLLTLVRKDEAFHSGGYLLVYDILRLNLEFVKEERKNVSLEEAALLQPTF